MDEEFPVKVYVYDLSHGLAAVYSPIVLGSKIDAIYHTSAVIYGQEFYIDQGIQVCTKPGTTKYGTPIEVLDMGTTLIDQDTFHDFLQDLRDHDEGKYNAPAYDLFDNNCNHFTDVLLEFSVGRNLEDRILKLPQQVLANPNGQLLRQMLGGGSGGASGNAHFGF
ncbi:DUF862-domain-containing protein [Metschnikowia bicuspidata var. bicuspidata NRRL YB-4993]|uniref:DUF862-domain-containing protein n=1 Tax=Metschnikowia bicuspidata var. bicuspidata NRRL YB-4993 TaxID=869754 RepID=A0A1A0H599_9ASCO|nr:DUF862-domain-containing protein [Metschnikowia bicuspidata var. bicuspidata NRRL YB-4993]OBA19211.1 DUF862-domain-containing protein [Metschnikowia bicuspidata var. bicuspidata NRRL YB-4993]